MSYFGRSYSGYHPQRPEFTPQPQRAYFAGPTGDGFSRKRQMSDSQSPAIQPAKYSRPAFPAQSEPRQSMESSKVLMAESSNCVEEIQQELEVLENSQFPEIHYLNHSRRLLNEEVAKLNTNLNSDWLDVSDLKFFTKITKFVLLPKPRFGKNIVGRLFGPKGETLKKVCAEFKCRIKIAGSGSSRNSKSDEQKLLESGDPKFSHFAHPLHAEVTTTGPPYKAYDRLTQVLRLVHELITNDETFERNGIVFEADINYGKSNTENDQESASETT